MASLLSESGIYTTLCSYCMTSCREKLRYACCVESSLRQAERCSKTGSASADDEGVILMVLGRDLLGRRLLARALFMPTIIGYLLSIKGDASFARSG